MKTDKTLLAAIVILIGLVGWLLLLSLQRQEELSRAIEKVETVKVHKPEAIDYDRLSEITREQIAEQIKQLPAPIHGKDGANGLNGINGIGSTGANGKDGDSAYQLWLAAGNTGTTADFLESLKGEKGDKGDTPLLRLNVSTGLWETKLPSDLFWLSIPTCQGVVCE